MISGRAGQSVTLMSCSFALQHKGSYSPRRSWPGATMVGDAVKSLHPQPSTGVPRQRLPPCGWQSGESQWQRRESSCDGTAVPAAGASPCGRLKSEWLRQYHTAFSLRMFFHGGPTNMQPFGTSLLVYLAFLQDRFTPSGPGCAVAVSNYLPSPWSRTTANANDYRHSGAHSI